MNKTLKQVISDLLQIIEQVFDLFYDLIVTSLRILHKHTLNLLKIKLVYSISTFIIIALITLYALGMLLGVAYFFFLNWKIITIIIALPVLYFYLKNLYK